MARCFLLADCGAAKAGDVIFTSLMWPAKRTLRRFNINKELCVTPDAPQDIMI